MNKRWIVAAACLAGMAISAPAMARNSSLRTLAASSSGGAAPSTSVGVTSPSPSGGGGATSTPSASTAVPEPGMLGLFGLGLLALGYARFRRRPSA